MKFTSTLPTEPGFYAWRQLESDPAVPITLEFLGSKLRSVGCDVYDYGLTRGGLWCRLLPEDELKATQEKHNELLYAVACKFDGETRHQTALRYIQEAEIVKCESPKEIK